MPALPLVLHVGFSGSRSLRQDGKPLTTDHLNHIRSTLENALAQLPSALGLSPRHFLCGISQMAIGGDFLFTQACHHQAIPQRIFLPQNRCDFLNATEPDLSPDFSPAEKETAATLFHLPHIIQERVASDSPHRTDRFEDTNLEILRACDVAICLLRDDGLPGKPGGTREFLQDALTLQKPVLEILLRWENDQPSLTTQWHRPPQWAPPSLPPEFAAAHTPNAEPSSDQHTPLSIRAYLDALMTLGSHTALHGRNLFRQIAFTVIGTHLLATLGSLIVLKLSPHHHAVPWILAMELALLLVGFVTHQYLHHAHVVRVWATSRLTTEIARSVGALDGLHLQLSYLFALPFPAPLRPLLHTINTLHLASTVGNRYPWLAKKNEYRQNRIESAADGQLPYYTRTAATARKQRHLAHTIFLTASIGAILATGLKLTIKLAPALHFPGDSLLSLPAILLPVVAVASLSLAASFDLEARVHTFEETVDYLHRILPYLDAVRSERAFTHLILQIESRLLGETVNWYSRRSFTSVT